MGIAKKFLTSSVAAAALAIAAAPVMANDFAFDIKNAGAEVGVSTLGGFIAPTYDLNDRVKLRAPIYFGSYDGDDSYEGNDLSYGLDLQSTALLVDYHPFHGKFRVTGGLAFGGYEANATVTNPELGDYNFTGEYDFRLEQKSTVAPVLAVGYVQPLTQNISLVGEMGGKFSTYRVGTNLDAIADPLERENMADEIAEINDDLKDIKVTPFLSAGIKFSF